MSRNIAWHWALLLVAAAVSVYLRRAWPCFAAAAVFAAWWLRIELRMRRRRRVTTVTESSVDVPIVWE